MLDYKEFREQLMQEIHRRYGEQKITVENIFKINKEKEGIMLGESGMVPVFYTEDLYQIFSEEADWEALFRYVETMRKQKPGDFDAEWITEWKSARKMVKPYVVNYKRNQELLTNSQSVYQVILDLAVVYYLNLPSEQGWGLVPVSAGMLKNWGITAEELQEQSRKNVVYEIKSLRQLLGKGIPWMNAEEKTEEDSLLCLSNKETFRGAAGMLIGDCLRDKAQEEHCNFYILPSSIHEVILVKDDGIGEHAESLKQMVSEINADPAILPISDYLSDSVYYYDRVEDKVRIAA